MWLLGLIGWSAVICGVYLIGEKRVAGFYVNVFANALLIVDAVLFAHWSLVFAMIAFTTLNIVNIWKWQFRKRKPKTDSFESLLDLEKNWDSYGADPPNELAIGRAKAFVAAVTKGDDPQIGPSVEGGVGVTIGEYYLEFCNEADPDGVEMIGVRMFKPKHG